ncbi:MAG TPA: hypothetical protein ENH94_04345 [Phycisphaerales bacterium]|nr:hypothetical protein [Phycisphaerales bacterium]
MRKVLVLCVAALVAFSCVGCGVPEFIGAFASTPYAEQKVDAEYKLKSRGREKVLVFVDVGGGSGAGPVVQQQMSDMIGVFLAKKVRLKKENILSYRELSRLQRIKGDLREFEPSELGKELGAGVVLYVLISDYSLYEVTDHGYYYGSLSVRGILFDSESGEVLWPESKTGRAVKAVVEAESKGRERAVGRLVMTTAYGIVRNFYRCPKPQYRMRDEDTSDPAGQWDSF